MRMFYTSPAKVFTKAKIAHATPKPPSSTERGRSPLPQKVSGVVIWLENCTDFFGILNCYNSLLEGRRQQHLIYDWGLLVQTQGVGQAAEQS